MEHCKLFQKEPLPGFPGDFSLGRIEVKPATVKVDVIDEPLFVPVSVRFLDQSLNLIVESFQGTIAEAAFAIGADVG